MGMAWSEIWSLILLMIISFKCAFQSILTNINDIVNSINGVNTINDQISQDFLKFWMTNVVHFVMNDKNSFDISQAAYLLLLKSLSLLFKTSTELVLSSTSCITWQL